MALLVLSACGNNEDGAEGNGNGNGNGDSDEATEITLWVAGNSQDIQETFNGIIDDFNNQSDNIEVNVQFEPWGELDQKLSTSLAGGVGPDIFMHGAAAAAGFASEGQIEPLDSYFEGWDDLDDFNEGYMEAGIVDGEHYVLPIQGANRMMFYRHDLFEEAGVEVPETMEELIEVSEAFVERDGDRYERAATTLPTEGNDLQQVWSSFLWSNGGDILNDDFSEAVIHSDEAIKAIEDYTAFFENELTPLAGIDGQGDQHSLGTGEVAFTFDGVWVIDQLISYTPDAYENVSVAAPPAGMEGTTTLVGSSGFFMNANSDNKDAAAEVLEFMGNEESIARVSEELKFLPVRDSIAEADFIQDDRLMAEFVELAAEVDGQANPNIPRWTAIRDIVASNVESAIYGQVSPEEALQNAEQEINAELQR